MAISLNNIFEQKAQDQLQLSTAADEAGEFPADEQLNGEIEESLQAARKLATSMQNSPLASMEDGSDPSTSLSDAGGIAGWLKNTLPSWLLKLFDAASEAPEPPESTNRTTQRTAYAADILAHDPSLWQHGDNLKKSVLQDIVNTPRNHAPDTVRAAQILLDNPKAFDKIDGATTGGKKDGVISRQGLVNYGKMVTMETPPAVLPAGMPGPAFQRSAAAATVLADDPALWQSQKYLDIGDLKDIVAHPSQHPPVTVAAAKTMLDHPSHFSLADGEYTKGKVDGEVWRQDLIKFAKSVNDGVRTARFNGGDASHLEAFMEKALAAATTRARHQAEQAAASDAAAPMLAALAQQRIEDAQRARQTLLEDTDLVAGKAALTMQDLQNVLMDPYGHAAETVSAALYVLQHPEAMMDE